MSNKKSIQSFMKAGFMGLILSSPLQFTNAVVNAVEVESTVITSNSAVKSVVTTSDGDRVKRKIELQKKANAGGKGDSYMDSLSREKEKVQGMKKSKSARSQDLCEVLGRGC